MVCMDYNGRRIWGRDALSYNIDQEAKEHLISAELHCDWLSVSTKSCWRLHRCHDEERQKPCFSSIFFFVHFVWENLCNGFKHGEMWKASSFSSFDVLGRSLCNHAAESWLNATVKNSWSFSPGGVFPSVSVFYCDGFTWGVGWSRTSSLDCNRPMS